MNKFRKTIYAWLVASTIINYMNDYGVIPGLLTATIMLALVGCAVYLEQE